jgi:ParB family chromosome partitioning protein
MLISFLPRMMSPPTVERRNMRSVAREVPREPVVSTVALELIKPSPRNPRQNLESIDELAASIRAYGLLQPIVLRKAGRRYEIVAGHRRFAAVQALGWQAIGAIIRSEDQERAYILTLVENLQRDDLTPKEEARALEVLVRERAWSTRQVAEAVMRSPAYVSKRLRVFEDPILAPLVLQNRLSVSAAEELLPLSPTRRRTLAEKAVAEAWEHGHIRRVVRGQSARPNPREASLLQRVNQVRQLLKVRSGDELTQAERRALRLLFTDLAQLAKVPAERRARV